MSNEKKEEAIEVLPKKAQENLPDKFKEEIMNMESSPKEMANMITMSTPLEIKRMCAIQMIQSGLLPNTLATVDQLEDEELREKAIGGVIAIMEYGRELNITPWVALNGMHVVQGRVVMGIHMYMGLALRNNILVDVVEDYKKLYSATDKTKLVDIQTTVEITRKYPEFNNLVKTYKFTKRWNEIVKAGLDSRDNYKKRPRHIWALCA